MRFLTVGEAAKVWGISERRVRLLCASGRIDGALRTGWAWSIPDQAKPGDARSLRHLKNRNLRTGVQSFHVLDARKVAIDHFISQCDGATLSIGRASMAHLLLLGMIAAQSLDITPGETTAILKGNIVPRLSLSDHLAVLNYQAAIEQIRLMAGTGERLSEQTGISLFQILMRYRLKGDVSPYREGSFSEHDRAVMTVGPSL